MLRLSRRFVMPSVIAASLFAGAFVGYSVRADQPHMHAALDALKIARDELDKAESDKGGHRAKAIELVRDAIGQVERGIEFDRHH